MNAYAFQASAILYSLVMSLVCSAVQYARQATKFVKKGPYLSFQKDVIFVVLKLSAFISKIRRKGPYLAFRKYVKK